MSTPLLQVVQASSLTRALTGPLRRTVRYAVVLLAALLILPAPSSYAQTGTLTGQVTDQSNSEPLPGATIQIATLNMGTATSGDGTYTLDGIPAGTHTVRVSFVGYNAVEREVDVAAGEQVTADFVLAPRQSELDEVVVTAQQIEREAKSLGYSVSSVDSEDLERGKEANVVKSLSGKVPGISITEQSGNVGSGANIVLRGVASLGGDNQPLFVIDGVPVFNSNIESGAIGTLTSDGNARIEGSYDTGNRISQIAPENIKSISVLKGAAAAALYGQRAKNGVVLIETKTGRDNPNTSVQVSSSIIGSQPLVLPDFQNGYAPGSLGKYDVTNTDGWGPRIAGQVVPSFTGEALPLSAEPDNVENFYDTGTLLRNSVTFSNAADFGDFRLGFTRLGQAGIVPESDLERYSLNLNAGARALDNRLEARIGSNYIKETTTGRVAQGGNDPNILATILNFVPRNVSNEQLRSNVVDSLGNQIPLTPFVNNPYWITERNPFETDAERFFGFTRLTFDITDWLTAQGRFGTDIVSETRRSQSSKGTIGAQDGEFADDFIRERQIDSDLSLRFNRSLSDDFSLQGILGHNVNQQTFERTRNESVDLNVAGLFNFTNANTNTPSNIFSRRRIIGVYGDVTLGFRDYAFLEVTGRNDWSSTLPKENRSFFYPSVNLSVVFTDLLDREYDTSSDILSYGKIRANYAEVGSDEDPYQLSFDFIPNASVFGQFGADIVLPFAGRTAFEASETIPPTDLKPQRQKSWELGTELGFFNGRLTLDFTYYNQRTEDQIISLPVPQASGFDALRTNVGEIKNEGVELVLTGSPITTSRFGWRSTFNFSTNNNTVVSLAEGIDEFVIDSGFNGLQIRAVPGDEIAIFGVGWLRDPETGLPIINEDTGLRQSGVDQNLGDLYPDFNAGFNNTLRVGAFDFSFLIDWSQGGNMFSATVNSLRNAGLVAETAQNRGGTFIDEGVIVTRDPATNEIVDRRPNDVPVQSMEAFWGQYANQNIIEAGVFDATYVKLREASLTFNLPDRWLAQSPIQSASFSVEGRNLLLIYSAIPHIDPETNVFGAGAAVGQGLEFNNLPSTRTLGATLNLSF